MLENVNLKKKLSREKHKRALPGLQHRLYDLEKACWDHGLPTVIVFEGWDAGSRKFPDGGRSQTAHHLEREL